MNKQYILTPIQTHDDVIRAGKVRSQSWGEAYKNIIPDKAIVKRTPHYCSRKLEHLFSSSPMIKGIIATDIDTDEAVGYITYGLNMDNDKNTASIEIYALYTLAKTYGTGLSQMLLHQAETDLQHTFENIKEITLWVLQDNKRARAFYKKEGYFADGNKEELPNLGDNIIRIRMTKQIC